MMYVSRVAALAIVVVLLATVGLAVSQSADLGWLVAREASLRQSIAAHPLRSWLLGLALYFVLSLAPGSAGKSVVCGWFFGWLPAVVMVNLSLTLAAMTTFLASRFLLRDMIRSRFGHFLERLDNHLQRDTAGYLLMLRLAHVPFTAVNYTLGAATNSRPLTFWWTTQLGLLPSTMVFVFAGSRLPTLASVARGGVWAVMDPWLIAVLVLTAAAPLGWRLASRWGAGKRDSATA